MAIKFDKIQPGMTLYDRSSGRMGNTTIRTIREYRVSVKSVDAAARTAVVSWNSNTPETWYERQLTKLHTWSMYDKTIATYETGMFGSIRNVRKLTKAELTQIKHLKCDDCGTHENVEATFCPYDSDVNNKETPANLCPKCYNDRGDDI